MSRYQSEPIEIWFRDVVRKLPLKNGRKQLILNERITHNIYGKLSTNMEWCEIEPTTLRQGMSGLRLHYHTGHNSLAKEEIIAIPFFIGDNILRLDLGKENINEKKTSIVVKLGCIHSWVVWTSWK